MDARRDTRPEGSVLLQATMAGEFMKAHRIAQMASDHGDVSHLQLTCPAWGDSILHRFEVKQCPGS